MPITMLHRERTYERVSPRDCALLVGVPLNRQSFIAKYNRSWEGNFAQSFLPNSDAERAWPHYADLVARMEESIRQVENAGVSVYRALTKELLSAAMRYRVVTIASQARSAMFMPADILDSGAISCLARGGVSDEEAKKSASRDLNGLLSQMMKPVRDGLGRETRYQLELIRCRAEIEARHQGAFTGGAGIEFSSGFEKVTEVSEMFPPSFDGVVDLIVCNSLVLAEMIRVRCRHALSIAMGDITKPMLRFPMYVAIIQLLEKRPLAYDHAMRSIQRKMEGA
jgi:hypothetical protein